MATRIAQMQSMISWRRCQAVAVTVALAAVLSGCTNPEVGAGYEGYVYYKPLIFGKMEFRESLPGPASTGASWRLFTINIDMREDNHPETFELLSSDDLKVDFEVNTRIRLQPGSVKVVVEEMGGEDWYNRNVKEPLRTIVRREVMKISATDIQLKTDVVGRAIYEALLEKYKDTPVEIQSVDIGSFKFPEDVNEAIRLKIAKQQELERQTFVLEKTRKEAAIRVLDALKLAKKQNIISATLDPMYVQWRAVQVYRSLAESKNKTIMMLPNTAEGTGMPLVLSEGKRKLVTPEDEQFLMEIEERYMRKIEERSVPGVEAVPGVDVAPPGVEVAPEPGTEKAPGEGAGAEAAPPAAP